MLAELLERQPFPGSLRLDERDGLVERDRPHLIVRLEARKGLASAHEGAEATQPRDDHFVRLGVRTDRSRKLEQLDRILEIHRCGVDLLGDAHPLRLFVFTWRGELDVRPVRPVLELHHAPFNGMLTELLPLGVEPVERARALALRIAGAAEEPAVAIPPNQHGTTALVARLPLGGEDLLDDLVGVRLTFLDPVHEAWIEITQQLAPISGSVLDLVELAFHPAREVYVEDVGQHSHQQLRDDFTKVRRMEPSLFEFHVPPVGNDGDDRRVRGRPSDPLLLELLHQARFGVTRRWLGEVLPRLDTRHVGVIALVEIRERLQVVESSFVSLFGGFLVQLREAVELHDRPRCPEQVPVTVRPLEVEIGGRGVVDGGPHLAGYEPHPDHFVQLGLIYLDVARDLGRKNRHIGRADGFVSILCRTLILSTVETWRVGHITIAVLGLVLDPRPRLLDGRR